MSEKGDLISRKALLDCIDSINEIKDRYSADWIYSFVKSAPAADAAPVVHGRWIEKSYLLGTTRYCSECGENYGMPHGVFNYCPNCGAKMVGKENVE